MKNYILPIVTVAGLVTLLGCGGSKDPEVKTLNALAQRQDAAANVYDAMAEAEASKRVAVRQHYKTEIVGNQARAIAEQSRVRDSLSIEAARHPREHAHGNCGKGYTGSMHGVTVDINGDVYVDINATPRYQGKRTNGPAINH